MKRTYIIIITGFIILVTGFVALKSKHAVEDIKLPAIEKYISPAGTNIFFDTIAATDIDVLSPARGANTFYNKQSVNIPDADTITWALDNDRRFLWSQLQPDSEAVYNWSDFDDHVKQSIDKGQRVSFGIATVCTSCPVYDGIVNVNDGTASYPVFVHNRMQTETVKDWNFEGVWIPNWNSESYLSAFEKFLDALATHIAGTSYKNINFKNVIYKVDIRGFGNWGEWHTYPWIRSGNTPAGATATDASLIRIIDAYIKAFPDYPLITNINMFNGETGVAVGYHGLTAKNNFGKLGIRSDHLGDKDITTYDVADNKRTYKGLSFKDEIINRWKTSPICGEPMNDKGSVTKGGDIPYFDLPDEIKILHISQFSNISSADKDPGANNIFRASSKACGYRLLIYDGILSKKITLKDSLHLSLAWANVGIAPVYEQWNTIIELRKDSSTIWSGASSFNPRLFLPGRLTTHDSFILPASVPAGDYSLYLIIKDPSGYRKPFPLAIQGRKKDGSYLLGQINIGK